jgi:predicted ATPase
MLQVALGSPLMAVKGYSSPEVEDAYERARELSQEARDAPQLFRALWGLAAFYQSRSELRVAREIADQLLELAEGSGEPTLRLLANLTAGANSYYEGRWSSALERLQRTVDLYDPVEHRALAYVYGQDPGMIAAVFAGICRWHLGQPDSGLRDAESALAMGRRERVHPLGLAFALDFLALLHYLRREGAEVRTCAEEAIAIAEEHGFVLELGLARLFRGWALAQSGSAAEGVGMMQEGLGDLNATGATVGAPGILGVLADGQRRAGRLNDALATVQLALDYSKRQSNPCWDAELLRLHGELLLASESPDRQAAEARLRSALALAQSQGSRLLALRAAVSLGQLLRQQGGLDEAREVVAAAREGLGEGFRTRDLRDADELLRSA